MLTRIQIIELLDRDLDAANARLAEARSTVDAIITEAPGMLPQPDGQYRIAKAVKERNDAREAVLRAAKRSLEFIVQGIVPDDLDITGD